MTTTLAFDVYGTLIDTHGVVSALELMAGNIATEFSESWRQKQLEYSFRRGLMQDYVDFGVCTRQALEYCCQLHSVDLSAHQKEELLVSYSTLPAFADVAPALAQLEAADVRLYAFSNGGADAVETLLANAGIRDHFLDVVSCDEIRTFKPNPAVYAHFLQRAGSTEDETWLVSSNPFDVIGARAAGWRAAWVKRSGNTILDPWGVDPTSVVGDLGDLEGRLLTGRQNENRRPA